MAIVRDATSNDSATATSLTVSHTCSGSDRILIAGLITNGSGAAPVEYWRYALQAPTAGIAGANLAVSPPAYIFATGENTTLCITCDNASLVHYSVGYFKESA